MLLSYGIGKQPSSWHVLETKAPMYARVYLILGGNTVYRSDRYECSLEKDWLYIFPSHVPYEMTTDPADPLQCLHMHLDLHNVDLSRLVSVPVQHDPEMAHMLQVIHDAIAANYPVSYMEMLVQSFEGLCLLKNLFQTVDDETRRFISILRKNYRTSTTVAEISAALGYSTEYFIRIFKRKLGVSPHQYIISLRMSDAVRMLAGDVSLEEISGRVGYTDGHSFSNAFRRYYGISPTEYRAHYVSDI